MSTSYDECYEVFLSNINDADILYPLEEESQVEYKIRLQNILLQTFKNAIIHYTSTHTSFERDDTTQQFVNSLKDIEIAIIGLLMVIEYYNKQLNYLVGLKGSFSDKDWTSHDKSAQMSQYRQLINEKKKEIKALMLANSFYDNGTVQLWYDENGQ